MPTDRRQFLGGLFATGLFPKSTWADAGSPSYLSAAAHRDGSYVLCGISRTLDVTFQIPLPDRGHAAAAHPTRSQAVAFARRPGTFAVVIDCMTGTRTAVLEAPSGRHFNGHGAFSTDGQWLFTTENDFEAGRGRVGVWDVMAGYLRAAEFNSGGIGPHDIKRLPGSETLVIANGGIDTHPGSGRAKLNIPTMCPNLAYVEDGVVIEQVSLPENLRKNSIRHLAVSSTGETAFGMQWQGGGPVQALVGTHRRGDAIRVLSGSTANIDAMQGYVGSIVFSRDNSIVAATSPRGGLVQFYDALEGTLVKDVDLIDVCGIASHDAGFVMTSGTGEIRNTGIQTSERRSSHPLSWDNHLVSI